MELFTRLFGGLLVFVYHCFDRVVINGYLSGLSRPGQVAYFFREVVGEPVLAKEVLSRRTNEYQSWVEAFARNHGTLIEWAESGVRKEDYVRPALRPEASSVQRSNRSSMAITSFAPIAGTRSSSSTRSFPLFCATKSVPTIWLTSA